jgi:HD-like signal output (HDOD) protein
MYKVFSEFRTALQPEYAKEICGLLSSEETNSTQIVKGIARDPQFTAEIIKHANSTQYAGSQPTVDLKICVSRLGLAKCTAIFLQQVVERAFLKNDVL